MKAHRFNKKLIAGVLGAAVVLTPLALSAAQKPKYSIKEVMKAIHKGEDNIGKRVVKGQASKDDLAKMVEYYQSLPLNDPPRGDKADWDAKTAALVKAAHDLQSGKSGAIAAYKEAANCKACHSAHKPEDKK
jgi:hypothetical protein